MIIGNHHVLWIADDVHKFTLQFARAFGQVSIWYVRFHRARMGQLGEQSKRILNAELHQRNAEHILFPVCPGVVCAILNQPHDLLDQRRSCKTPRDYITWSQCSRSHALSGPSGTRSWDFQIKGQLITSRARRSSQSEETQISRGGPSIWADYAHPSNLEFTFIHRADLYRYEWSRYALGLQRSGSVESMQDRVLGRTVPKLLIVRSLIQLN